MSQISSRLMEELCEEKMVIEFNKHISYFSGSVLSSAQLRGRLALGVI